MSKHLLYILTLLYVASCTVLCAEIKEEDGANKSNYSRLLVTSMSIDFYDSSFRTKNPTYKIEYYKVDKNSTLKSWETIRNQILYKSYFKGNLNAADKGDTFTVGYGMYLDSKIAELDSHTSSQIQRPPVAGKWCCWVPKTPIGTGGSDILLNISGPARHLSLSWSSGSIKIANNSIGERLHLEKIVKYKRVRLKEESGGYYTFYLPGEDEPFALKFQQKEDKTHLFGG